MKHTQGEWNVNLHGRLPLPDGDKLYIATANFGKNNFPITKQEAEANAKLIACAPKLLTALQQLYCAVKDIPEVKDFLDGNLIEAQEAIERAITN